MATLTKDYQIIGTSETVYFGSCYAYITLHGKYNSQSVTNNTSTYEITANLNVFNGYIGNYQSTPYSISSTGLTTKSGDLGQGNFSTRTIDGILGTVTHNSDGTKSITASASINFTAWGKAITVTATADLPKIPREFTKTPTITLTSKTETTMNYSWSTSETCSAITWSGGGTATFTGLNSKSGTISVTGLTANTSYSHYGTFKRSDSGLTTKSNTLTNSTYAYPYCTEAPDFTIGNDVTIKLYNPLNRNVQIQMWSHASGQFVSDLITINGTSYTGFSNISDRLYNSIPNSKNSQYNIDVHYNDNKAVKGGGYYNITGNETPIFTNFDYQDIANDVQLLVGNNKILVDNNSICKFTIGTPATSQNGSTMKKYICYWGGISTEINYENKTIESTGIISNGNVLKITAIDSRGLSTTVSKTIQNVAYVNPTINSIDLIRKNGIEAETYLTFKATLWNGEWNTNKANELTYVGYRVLINNTWTNYFDVTSTVKSKINEFAYNTTLNLTLNENSQVKIHSNGSNNGFELGKQFVVQLLIKDGNGTQVFTSPAYQATIQGIVTDGKVGMSRYKDNNGNYHYGINVMPDEDATLFVDGNIKTNSIYGKNSDAGIKFSGDNDTESIILSAKNRNVIFRPNGVDNSDKQGYLDTDGNFYVDNFVGKINGNIWDVGTNNTKDTWVFVLNSGKIQHRVINANVNDHYNGYTTNLNSATTTGWYRFNQEASNRPTTIAAWGIVVVQNDGAWVFQTAYATYTTNATRIAHRGYVNGSWTSWSYVPEGTGPISLYDNANGTTGTVTLSETSANFKYLEIFYMKNNSYTSTKTIHSVKVHNPNGKKVSLVWGAVESSSVTQVQVATKTISGTSITHNNAGYINGTATSASSSMNANEFYITKVVGYK